MVAVSIIHTSYERIMCGTEYSRNTSHHSVKWTDWLSLRHNECWDWAGGVLSVSVFMSMSISMSLSFYLSSIYLNSSWKGSLFGNFITISLLWIFKLYSSRLPHAIWVLIYILPSNIWTKNSIYFHWPYWIVFSAVALSLGFPFPTFETLFTAALWSLQFIQTLPLEWCVLPKGASEKTGWSETLPLYLVQAYADICVLLYFPARELSYNSYKRKANVFSKTKMLFLVLYLNINLLTLDLVSFTLQLKLFSHQNSL